MLDLDKIRDLLADRNLRIVALATGLHYNTVYNIARNRFKTAKPHCVAALSDYFLAQNGEKSNE